MILRYLDNTNQLLLFINKNYSKTYSIGELLVSFIELDFNMIDKLVDDSLNLSEPKNKEELEACIAATKILLEELSNLHDFFKDYYAAFNFKIKDINEKSADFFKNYAPVMQKFLKELRHDMDIDIITADEYYETIQFYFNTNKIELYNGLTPIQRNFIYLNFLKKVKGEDINLFHIAAPVNPDGNLMSSLYNSSTPEEMVNIIKRTDMQLYESYDLEIKNACYIELQKILAKGIIIKKCENCKKHFINSGRADAIYCDRLVDDKGNTCKDVGAMNTYRENVKNDPIMEIYQKHYKKNYARTKYKSESKKMSKHDFEKWSNDAMIMRDKAKSREITYDDLKEWLENN